MKYLIKSVVALAIWIMVGVATAATSSTPTAAVSKAVDTILAVLQVPDTSVEEKRTEIRTLIKQTFDFSGMSQRILGKYWRKASKEQKKEFVYLYSLLLQNTYLVMVEEYTGEKVKYVSEKIRKKDKYASVSTKIITDSVDVPVVYKTVYKKEKWLVYDVVIEGVSLVSNYRTSFASVIRKKGIDGLLVELKKKSDKGLSVKEGT